MKKLKLVAILLAFSNLAFAQENLLVKNKILNKDSKVEVIAENLKFTEGPLWLPKEKSLIFSDIPANKQYIWNKDKGLEVFKNNSGFANGNILDEKGDIITARHDRTVVKTLKDKKEVLLASHYKNKKLNSPNDLALYKDGSIYFTDPHFGLIGYGPKKDKERQKYRAIYKLNPSGELIRVAKELKTPNGIAFSKDFKNVYITNYADGNIYKYDVMKDGKFKNQTLFAVQKLADGIKVDKKGNIFASSKLGVSVYNKEGEHLGDIKLHTSSTNLNFGEDGKSLFITAQDKVYKVPVLTGI